MTAIHGGERVLIPQPRKSQDYQPSTSIEQQASEKDRHKEAVHRALALTADQAIVSLTAYNTVRVTKDGDRLPGGKLVIKATVDGQPPKGTGYRYIDVYDDHRGGLEEDVITDFGQEATTRPAVETIVL